MKTVIKKKKRIKNKTEKKKERKINKQKILITIER